MFAGGFHRTTPGLIVFVDAFKGGFSASFTSQIFFPRSCVIIPQRDVRDRAVGQTVDDTRVARAFDREVIEQDVVDGGDFRGIAFEVGGCLST